jgi:putative nucleotidyltransferase with HDIG domain
MERNPTFERAALEIGELAMHHVTVIGGSRADPKSLRRQFAGVLDIDFVSLEKALCTDPDAAIVFDINLNNEAALLNLKEWLARKPPNARAIFLIDKTSHLQRTRAYGLGATDILHPPINGRELLTILWGDVASLSADPDNNAAIRKSPAVAAAVDTLKNIFASACLGEQLDPSSVNSVGDGIVGQVETQGLSAWIETVRTHHSLTYQHCLLVTGLAVAFGQQIGVSRADRQRLSFAGMLHDIGKARVPLAILEKPGRLDEDEMAMMKKHPQFGFDALGTVPALPGEMLDMVVHHHEYLDGSGYPHGLHAREISDLVRMITIADVFGALIERRSYKPPLSGSAAYQILLDMGPKLDQDLVRAFRPVADLGLRDEAACSVA